MTDLKSKGFLGALVIFTVTDFKFWRICLVNISVGMVGRTLRLGVPCSPESSILLAHLHALNMLRSEDVHITMRAESVAYMIYLEEPEYPEYVMHIFLPKVFLDPQIWEYVR